MKLDGPSGVKLDEDCLLLLAVPSVLVFFFFFFSAQESIKSILLGRWKKKMLVLDKASEGSKITYLLAKLSFSGLKVK